MTTEMHPWFCLVLMVWMVKAIASVVILNAQHYINTPGCRHGSMYPFTGHTSNEFSPQQSSVLLSERMAFKLHRQGLVMNSIGADSAVCFEYPSAIIPKERWRYQMVNKYPDVAACHPFGRSVMRWETGHMRPDDRKNFGYLMWRKRNCVFL